MTAGEAETVRIRNALSEDLDGVLRVEEQCFSVPWSRESLKGALEASYGVFCVAQTAMGDIAGYAGMYCICGEGQITGVAVLPAYRRRGIAGALLRELERQCRERGGTRMTLEVRASNEGAQALYRKLGYAADGRRRGYYTRPAEDAILMSKDLTVC